MTLEITSVPAVLPTLNIAGSLEQRYRALLENQATDSLAWLGEQLQRADRLPDDLPASPERLDSWSAGHVEQVAGQYAQYLRERRQGAARRYFANRSQALYFLQQVAPTKAVDGAWLHGTLRHWQDPRYHGLIRTYLEELGEGDPRCNHVLIYQRLLSRVGCLDLMPLADERYLQGCLQLALGRHVDTVLPEVIGYNLGYEQPPLHLLITTFELAELGIDGHYFQLHVTIDNAASGHARRSREALRQLWPRQAGEAFYARVRRGYRLNDLGPAAPALAASFDLHRELCSALERKRPFGRFMHSDRCRLQGRTVNQWLSAPGPMDAFLQALQTQGWVCRNQAPARSRFWALIDGPSAPMFGVFTAYEKQLWHDWIAAEWQGPAPSRVLPGSWEAGLALDLPASVDDACTDIAGLIDPMAGNRHASPQGLWATRAYLRATGLSQGDCH
ncbi:iron-containing redox enzyme family protein [Pseudomonas entomophila]|uniref:iron-containing redox enzyme family protein n=1 Tax=Pseudomonas entomophila TaxID=312306 RepID=UPI0023D7FA67|nr:iron-containing redox enzyme family protein [Pseudomonas entomophila]MDF0732224.1 iron-containing redox enzyme family protein [Pseudomonas entomophila]